MEKKRICFVTNEFTPVSAGGIGMLVEQAVARMSGDGRVSVTVILVGGVEFSEAVKAHGKTHYPEVEFVGEPCMLASIPAKRILPEWAFTFPNYYRSWLIAEYLLARDAADQGFDVVEFPDYKGFGFVSLKHKRLRAAFPNSHFVVRIHGVTSIWNRIDGADIHSKERLQLYQMERYSLEHADSWTLPSQRLAQQYAQLLALTPPPLNLVTPVFKKLGERGAYWRERKSVLSQENNSSATRILFYGKQQHVKGLDLFVEAAVKLSEQWKASDGELEFWIIGQDTQSQWGDRGSYGDEVRKIIPPQMEKHIRFLGRVDLDTLPQLAAQCDMAVIPSRMETFCLAAHELNWIGIPLVLNRIPVFEDYFKDAESALFFDGSAADLKLKIETALWDESIRDRLRLGNAADAIASRSESSNDTLYLKLDPPQAKLTRVAERTPMVSVIVPYFNDMKAYVGETLESILAQDYPHVETIVVNDGSSDPEANEVFDSLRTIFADRGEFRFLSKPNGGLGSARNAAICEALGDYIFPLDSDDLIEPTTLRHCVEAMENRPELSAISTYCSFFEDGSDARNQIDYVIPYDLDPLLIFLENRAGVAASMFRKKVFETHRYDESLPAFEDWDLWMQLAVEGAQVEVLPELCFRYRRRVGSMVSSEGFARKAQLMHRLADRHSKHLCFYGDRLYKAQQQLIAEAAEQDKNALPHCKVYLSPDGQFNEQTSIYRAYAMESLVEFELRLPPVNVPTMLRFDPSAIASSIHLNWMSLHLLNDSDAVWVASQENDYKTLQIAGTARRIPHPDVLLVSAHGPDPQLLCPTLLPSKKPYVLRVSMRVFDRFEALLYEAVGTDYRHFIS